MQTEDGRYTIVFNGEIYNFPELRRELTCKGVKFYGRSDTEVVLHAFAMEGKDCLPKLNGIFALGIWDSVTSTLTLARDRFGVKPLYIFQGSKGVAFGSEIKAILASGIAPRPIDERALSEFILFGSALGTRTMFSGIRKLAPGSWVSFDSSGSASGTFWRIEDTVQLDLTEHDAIERTKELLERAVRRQLLSDVPIGVFLSGGIDSSSIVALASRHYKGRLKTFTAGFDFSAVSELQKARKVANTFGTDHTEVHVNGEDLADVVEELVYRHDEPFSDAANIPLYLMCRSLNGGTRVVLQGDGGDEMFGGYRRHSLMRQHLLLAALSKGRGLLTPFRWVSPFVRRSLRMLEIFALEENGRRMAYLQTLDTRFPGPARVLNEEWRFRIRSFDPTEQYLEFDRKLSRLDRTQRLLYADTAIWLADVYLEKVDKPTMAFGIEARVPYLDNELAEFALGLPAALKVKNGEKKRLLKKALRGTVPDWILDSKKVGFGVPYGSWLRGPLAQLSRERIMAACGCNGLFDQRVVEGVLDQQRRGNSQLDFLVWKMLQLSIWQDRYIKL